MQQVTASEHYLPTASDCYCYYLQTSQQCACALGADAFSRSLWTSDQSVLDFVSKAPNSTNFLFLTYDCARCACSCAQACLQRAHLR